LYMNIEFPDQKPSAAISNANATIFVSESCKKRSIPNTILFMC
jgi:hypothetical protein